jgi:hypothetical protein
VCLLASDYPLTLTADATAKTATVTISSSVVIRVERLMEESRRARVADALKYSGYGNFLNALRGLPPIGAIELQGRSVEIRYAHEQQEAAGRRLVLIADRPLLFLSGDREKPRQGFELTMVELHIDPEGGVTGRMLGAARVKPSPDGPVVDDFADVDLNLTARVKPAAE